MHTHTNHQADSGEKQWLSLIVVFLLLLVWKLGMGQCRIPPHVFPSLCGETGPLTGLRSIDWMRLTSQGCSCLPSPPTPALGFQGNITISVFYIKHRIWRINSRHPCLCGKYSSQLNCLPRFFCVFVCTLVCADAHMSTCVYYRGCLLVSSSAALQIIY